MSSWLALNTGMLAGEESLAPIRCTHCPPGQSPTAAPGCDSRERDDITETETADRRS